VVKNADGQPEGVPVDLARELGAPVEPASSPLELTEMLLGGKIDSAIMPPDNWARQREQPARKARLYPFTAAPCVMSRRPSACAAEPTAFGCGLPRTRAANTDIAWNFALDDVSIPAATTYLLNKTNTNVAGPWAPKSNLVERRPAFEVDVR
jgi:hypothetical protein